MLGSLISFFSSGLIIFLTPKNPSHLKFKKEDHRNLGYPISYYEGEGLTREMVQHRICVMHYVGKFLFPRMVTLVPAPSVPMVPTGQVGISPPVRSIIDSDFLDVKKGERNNHFKVAETTEGQSVKVKFTKEEIKTFNELSFKYHNSDMSIEELILELRAGGEIENWIAMFGIGLAIIVIIKNANSFQPNLPGRIIVPPHLQWLYDMYKPGQDFGYGTSSGPASITKGPKGSPTALGITRPPSMPHPDFVALSKEERRGVTHPSDMKIIHEGRPELTVGFWQSRYKVVDHGAVHDLPYTLKANNGTKTEKSDDNALKMMQSIVDMPNRDNVQWFEDGTYQGGTDREYPAATNSCEYVRKRRYGNDSYQSNE